MAKRTKICDDETGGNGRYASEVAPIIVEEARERLGSLEDCLDDLGFVGSDEGILASYHQEDVRFVKELIKRHKALFKGPLLERIGLGRLVRGIKSYQGSVNSASDEVYRARELSLQYQQQRDQFDQAYFAAKRKMVENKVHISHSEDAVSQRLKEIEELRKDLGKAQRKTNVEAEYEAIGFEEEMNRKKREIGECVGGQEYFRLQNLALGKEVAVNNNSRAIRDMMYRALRKVADTGIIFLDHARKMQEHQISWTEFREVGRGCLTELSKVQTNYNEFCRILSSQVKQVRSSCRSSGYVENMVRGILR